MPFTREQSQKYSLFNSMGPSEKEARLNVLYTFYKDPRFSPADRESSLTEIESFYTELKLEPKVLNHQNRSTIYCGSGYVREDQTMGTVKECYQKGKRVGDLHGWRLSATN